MSRYSSNLAFIDLLFNMILGFAFLFIVAFLLINDPTETADIEANVEYMITMSWEGDKDIDLDLWVQGPAGIVGFRDPSQGFLNLDRDDLGHRTDTIYANTEDMKVVYINQEIVNIRGFQPGEYIINGHYFFTKEKEKMKKETTAELKIIKLNPFEEVWQGTKKFAFRGQEETFIRFEMMENGRYKNIHDLPKNLVMKPGDANPWSSPSSVSGSPAPRNTRGSGSSAYMNTSTPGAVQQQEYQQFHLDDDPAYGGSGP